jgi:hypothetical protein
MKIETLQRAKEIEKEITAISNSLRGFEWLGSENVAERELIVSSSGQASTAVIPKSMCKLLSRIVSNELTIQLIKLREELESL